ncbi:MAG: UDP-N-acetylmuramate dehydrogenase [Clostridiales bacterium]|nr:UDP-N-acetylmuramate dehydrogenase [Clostridiales bacterium]MBR6988059.1 UDP-N-acetylmuramate dehydrogenase [Clostridiales bacterium]
MSDNGIQQNVPLAGYSTFRCGGPARFFAEPSDGYEVAWLFDWAKDKNVNVFVLGNGSNCLISDEGFDGLVIRIGKNMSKLTSEEPEDGRVLVTAGAGLSYARFGNYCVEQSLTGAEFACGIPGSCGGAVFMNAGAYGGETKDFISKVTYWNGEQIITIDGSQCEFGYRTSLFEKLNSAGKTAVILEMQAILSKGNKEDIVALTDDLRARRTASQPLDVPSAGSTFKRPEGYFAAKLIEEAGLKGFALDDSGAQVSPKHAGFVVNNGGRAKASDVMRLIDYVVEKVYESSGVKLEKEVRLVGSFGG